MSRILAFLLSMVVLGGCEFTELFERRKTALASKANDLIGTLRAS